ncbi:hypothetical protein MCOR34_000649 [Pyricularia oryzae]|nr:hypothetical protein MCOR34_000649 [Pyricularia oryzae]KAI6476770.1 hypothetical protein MCOR17_000935 [Pyricularia oryzae]KAI6507433.1 hypothetical protein MCOR13_002769 [Pyricularia oryzae]KAI6605351.1 hypothetical protein MCOR04_001160 [Pyricularia oryzae]
MYEEERTDTDARPHTTGSLLLVKGSSWGGGALLRVRRRQHRGMVDDISAKESLNRWPPPMGFA